MVIKYLDKIYTFLVINRESSFSKASRALGISQPAVTQQIRILENHLGVTLFERKKKRCDFDKRRSNIFNICERI